MLEAFLLAVVITIYPGDWQAQQVDTVELERQDGPGASWRLIQTITSVADKIEVSDTSAVGYVSYRSRNHNIAGYSPYAIPANILADSGSNTVFLFLPTGKTATVTRRKGDTSKVVAITVNKSQSLIVNDTPR